MILSLTNVSPQSYRNVNTAWSATTARTPDRNQIDISQPNEISSTWTRMDSLKLENQNNKKMLDDMNQQLSQLRRSLKTLTATQKETTEELNRQKN